MFRKFWAKTRKAQEMQNALKAVIRRDEEDGLFYFCPGDRDSAEITDLLSSVLPVASAFHFRVTKLEGQLSIHAYRDLAESKEPAFTALILPEDQESHGVIEEIFREGELDAWYMWGEPDESDDYALVFGLQLKSSNASNN